MLTLARLHEVLSYDPETGEFAWRTRRPGRLGPPGRKKRDGSIHISIDGHRYYAHRLAWFYVHGVWPENLIDHINRDPGDNRICNLREATRAQNAQNSGRWRHSQSPYKGTFYHKLTGKWAAAIRVNGHRIHLGLFATPEAGHAAYAAAAAKHFGEFARTA